MKRVLCIMSNMNAGGAETFLMKIYRCIDKSQYQMDFCVSVNEKNYYEDEIKKMGGFFYRIPTRSENIIGRKRELQKIIKENSYQYVLRVASNPISFSDLWFAKKSGVVKCSFRSSNSNDGGGRISTIINKTCRFLFMNAVDVKIAPSDLAAQFTFGNSEYVNGRVTIIHNGLDLSVYKFDEKARNKIRKEFGFENNEVIGHIGRFNTQKNHGYLLRIFCEYKKINVNAKLLLVGDGTMMDEIRAYSEELGIAKDVIFTGVRKDIIELLSAMDIFVFPSLFEGMPNTVIEAQATGLHCIISDSITREANVSGNVTYLSINDSPQLWAEEIQHTMLSSVRKDVKEVLERKGYDIQSCTEKFIKCVF